MSAETVDAILSEAGVESRGLEHVHTDSNQVWLGNGFALRLHHVGPRGRLQHEARVAARLPAAALYPRVIATGWTAGHDWIVLERVAGKALSVVWPRLSDDERRSAIHQFACALRAVHETSPDGLEPSFLFEGADFVPRPDLVAETLRAIDGSELSAEVRSALTERVSAWAPHTQDPAHSLIHGDLNFNNILWDAGAITALLDFEWARPETRDVDLLSFLAFCKDAELCVPDEVRVITAKEQYARAPYWLSEAYPELFAHPHVRERVGLYAIERWALGLNSPDPAYRRLAQEQLAEIVEGADASRFLVGDSQSR